jgi:hypothetical protein
MGRGAWSQSLSDQLSDGARAQVATAASNASARAMKTNFKELATEFGASVERYFGGSEAGDLPNIAN